jgi:hypothetical protein
MVRFVVVFRKIFGRVRKQRFLVLIFFEDSHDELPPISQTGLKKEWNR